MIKNLFLGAAFLVFCTSSFLCGTDLFVGGYKKYCLITVHSDRVFIKKDAAKITGSRVRVYGLDLVSRVKVSSVNDALHINIKEDYFKTNDGYVEVELPSSTEVIVQSGPLGWCLFRCSQGSDGGLISHSTIEKNGKSGVWTCRIGDPEDASIEDELEKQLKEYGDHYPDERFFYHVVWYMKMFPHKKKEVLFTALKQLMVLDARGIVQRRFRAWCLKNGAIFTSLAVFLTFMCAVIFQNQDGGRFFSKRVQAQGLISFSVFVFPWLVLFLVGGANMHTYLRKATWENVTKTVDKFDFSRLGRDGEFFAQDVQELKKLFKEDKSGWREGLADLSAWVAENAAEASSLQ